MTNNIIDLLKMKIEILKLKADDHNWQCFIPKDVKDELEKELNLINKLLKKERG